MKATRMTNNAATVSTTPIAVRVRGSSIRDVLPDNDQNQPVAAADLELETRSARNSAAFSCYLASLDSAKMLRLSAVPHVRSLCSVDDPGAIVSQCQSPE